MSSSSKDGDCKRILAIDSITRDVVKVYSSYKEAGDELGVPPSRISQTCRQRRFPSGGKYVYRLEDDYVRDEKWSSTCLCPIYATDGRRLRVFYDANEAADVLKVSRKTIRWYLTKGEGIGLSWGRCDMGLEELIGRLRGDAACQRA